MTGGGVSEFWGTVIIILIVLGFPIVLILLVRFKKITREHAMKIVIDAIKFAIGVTIIRLIIKWLVH